MDSISRVAVFVEVARRASFAEAGRALGMTGPAVSKHIKALESHLGVRLLHRTTRSVTLTEEGALYLERAGKAVEDLYEAERRVQELRETPAGRLKINAPMSFGTQFLSQPIAEFAREYPEVELEVEFNDRWVDVVREGFDVVVRIGVLEDSTLIARKLAECPLVLCAAPSFIERMGEPASPDNLSKMPAVIYNQHGQSEDWRFRSNTGAEGAIRLQRAFAANSAELQRDACIQGVGVAVLPIFAAAEALERGDLVQLLPNYQTWPVRGIYALFPQNRYLATRVRLFVDWLSQCSDEFPW